jgi:Flp pilus assembly CpaE family ATPase
VPLNPRVIRYKAANAVCVFEILKKKKKKKKKNQIFLQRTAQQSKRTIGQPRNGTRMGECVDNKLSA